MLSGDEMRAAGVVAFLEARAAEHVQPNGIDLSLDAVWRFAESGVLGASNADRRLPARESLAFDTQGWIDLEPGTYGIRYAEVVNMPNDCGGMCFPRSSLLRMGLDVSTAVWDAGYRGRGEGVLTVGNPRGVRIQRGARVAQLVLFRLRFATTGYRGAFQDEGITSTSDAPVRQ